MPRKKLKSALPAPRRPSSAQGELADSELLEILRRLAEIHRSAGPQLFYPLRDAARELRAPVSAISRVYEVLKREGILSTIRASRTMLEGRETARISFKGLIEMPLSISCFLVRADYQSFYDALRRESHRRGFLSNPVFISDESGSSEELGDMVEGLTPRYVVWYSPRSWAKSSMLRLKDKGIRVVGIADGGAPPVFCKYEIRRGKALAIILRRWRTDDDIRHATIVRTEGDSAAKETIMKQALEEAKMAYEYRDVDEETIEEVIAALGKGRRQGAILPAKSAAMLSLRAPSAFRELSGRCRIVLPHGPVMTLDGAGLPARVDLLTIDWRLVAKKIVHELETRRAFDETALTSFEASPQLSPFS